jgi:hypothetical protein
MWPIFRAAGVHKQKPVVTYDLGEPSVTSCAGLPNFFLFFFNITTLLLYLLSNVTFTLNRQYQQVLAIVISISSAKTFGNAANKSEHTAFLK